MSEKMVVTVPAFSVEVDREAWAAEYGVEGDAEIRADVVSYFLGQAGDSYPVTAGFASVTR